MKGIQSPQDNGIFLVLTEQALQESGVVVAVVFFFIYFLSAAHISQYVNFSKI